MQMAVKRFHSHGQELCKFIETKESALKRKEFNFHSNCLGHQNGSGLARPGCLIGILTPTWRT